MDREVLATHSIRTYLVWLFFWVFFGTPALIVFCWLMYMWLMVMSGRSGACPQNLC